MGTETGQFHDSMLHREALATGCLSEAFCGLALQYLRNIAAGLADQQGRRFAFVLLDAGHICVATLDLVDEVLFLEKLQCSIHRDGGRSRAVGRHPLDDLIGPDRLMAFGHADQNIAALPCEPRTGSRTRLLGVSHNALGTVFVVMLRSGKGHECYIITFPAQFNGSLALRSSCIQLATSMVPIIKEHPMRKIVSLALAAIALSAAPALAIDFTESDTGVVEFDMPSGNICCSYFPDATEGIKLSCSRVEPKYWTVTLTADGEMHVYKNPGEVPGCGTGEAMGNVFDYGTTWKKSGFKCTSSTSGLKCMANGTGFKLNKAGLTKY